MSEQHKGHRVMHGSVGERQDSVEAIAERERSHIDFASEAVSFFSSCVCFSLAGAVWRALLSLKPHYT